MEGSFIGPAGIGYYIDRNASLGKCINIEYPAVTISTSPCYFDIEPDVISQHSIAAITIQSTGGLETCITLICAKGGDKAYGVQRMNASGGYNNTLKEFWAVYTNEGVGIGVDNTSLKNGIAWVYLI